MLLVRVRRSNSLISSNMESLTEARRLEIISLARETSRYEHKVTSGIKYRQINAHDLLSRATEDLDVAFKVGDYDTVIRFEKFIPELRYYYARLLKKSGKSELSKNQKKSVISKSLVSALDSCEMKIECSCADFRYRFAYVATIGNYKLGVPENRPAPITNPNNKGSMCKHLSAVVGLYSRWSKRVVNDLYKIIEWDNTLLTK